MEIIEFISQPWAWYVAGPMIAVTMFLLLYFGKTFGVSSNLRTMCTIGGAGQFAEFFRFDWKAQIWNLVFVFGTMTGGFIATNYLSSENEGVEISKATIDELQGFGLDHVGEEFLPSELFSFEALFTMRGVIMLVFGGFLVGFGARYAGGCTSGHAITGLSNLQLPSLIAVMGFFIGGLIMTYFILPYVLQINF